MRWLAIAFALAGCVSSTAVPCGDRVCAAGTVCAMLDSGEAFCATKQQLDACTTPGPNGTCTTPDITAGHCNGGVCFAIACGDGVVDAPEICDDGNTTSGDGCSADCKSKELCGNGYLDPAKLDANHQLAANEQCDDGNLVSGDGCSSTCQTETLIWREVDFTGPAALTGATVAYDPGRERLVMFGGATLDSSNGKQVPSDQTFESSGAGWARRTSAATPIARELAAAAYDRVGRRVVMFGGQLNTEFTPYADMWGWDGTQWSPIAAATMPSARSGHAMVLDVARNVIVMFGGRFIDNFGGGTATFLADTWEWNGVDWKPIATPVSPPGRWGHAMAYDAARARVVMVGGFLDDAAPAPATDAATWEYDGTTWNRVTTATTAVAKVGFGGLAFAPTDGRVIAYGGRDFRDEPAYTPSAGTTLYATASPLTYVYTGSDWVHLAQSPGQDDAPGRSELAMATGPRGDIFAFGGTVPERPPIQPGRPNPARALSETVRWQNDPNFHAWQLALTAAIVPPPRLEAAFTSDLDTDTAYMFSGDLGPIDNDLWAFHDGTWTDLTPAIPPLQAPSQRRSAGLARDPVHHALVLFGGERVADQVHLDDTWIYKDSTWTQLAPTQKPPARAFPALIWDPALQRIVMFGGDADSGPVSDTWTWDGSNWTAIVAAHAPPPRAASGATYDALSRAILVTGGFGGTTFLDDLWAFDGTDWTEQPATTRPPSRVFPTFAFDGTRQRSIVFGGGPFAGGNDTWEWSSAAVTWRQVFPIATPPARLGHAAFETRAGLFIFGGAVGIDTNTRLGDMWHLRSESTTPEEQCSLVVDNDLDGSAGCADLDCWASCSPSCPPGTTCGAADPHCGDGTCDPFETCHSCPADCIQCTTLVCGDTFCDPGESHARCPGDCP